MYPKLLILLENFEAFPVVKIHLVTCCVSNGAWQVDGGVVTCPRKLVGNQGCEKYAVKYVGLI